MLSILRGAVVPLVFLGFSTAAVADQVYECNFAQKGSNGSWVPEIVVVNLDESDRRILVFDPVIKHFIGEPIEGKIDTDNTKRITFSWTYSAKSTSNQPAKMLYRMTMQKGSKSANVSAHALNYQGPYTAQGKCKVMQEK